MDAVWVVCGGWEDEGRRGGAIVRRYEFEKAVDVVVAAIQAGLDERTEGEGLGGDGVFGLA